MTGDDLKRLQDHFVEVAKKILFDQGRLRPVGFVVTLHKHVDKLFESGWGIEFIDPKTALLTDPHDDRVAALIVDLLMDWRKLYHAVLNVFPQTRDVLPKLLALGETVNVDDAYMRVMRPFLTHTRLDEKDIIAATMRQICDKVDAFACVTQSEAWMRLVEPSETVDEIYKRAPEGLGQDKKSVEVVVSSMETYDFARMVTVPIRREQSASPDDPEARDEGRVFGFGEPTERIDSPADGYVLEGRMGRFLKPLPEAS